MNSMLRQSHIKFSDLQPFLRDYDSGNTIAISIWAKNACLGLDLGSLVFIVEPVSLPFGLISFSRKEEEDNFRVVDLSIVVSMEANQPIVVNLTNNTYELRFLETLIEERAKKAIIDRKKLSFVAAKPKLPLSSNQLQELKRLSNFMPKEVPDAVS